MITRKWCTILQQNLHKIRFTNNTQACKTKQHAPYKLFCVALTYFLSLGLALQTRALPILRGGGWSATSSHRCASLRLQNFWKSSLQMLLFMYELQQWQGKQITTLQCSRVQPADRTQPNRGVGSNTGVRCVYGRDLWENALCVHASVGQYVNNRLQQT